MSSFRRTFAKGGGLGTDTTFDIKRCSKSCIELGALRQGLRCRCASSLSVSKCYKTTNSLV